MKCRQYIGLTGFTLKNCSNIFNHYLKAIPGRRPTLMCGILVSEKTLRGELNNYPHKYPRVEDIQKIFEISGSEIFNVLHFNTSAVGRELVSQLGKLVNLGGQNIHGVQFNMCWPHPKYLKIFKINHPSASIILQIGAEAIKMCRNNPRKIWEMINEYDGVIDHILLDMSGGRGKRMEIPFTQKCLEYIYPRRDSLGVGIAGGIDHIFWPEIEYLWKLFPELNSDTEGRMWRGTENDWYRIRMYFRKGGKILKPAELTVV